MKILATSDLHGYLPEIEPCDVLIIGGDICPDLAPPQQAIWLAMRFDSWLNSIPAKEVVVIAGNHDFVIEKYPEVVEKLSCHYLQDSFVHINGVCIHGTPWVPNLPGWAFYGQSFDLYRVLDHVPPDVDILVSHGPPYGYGDQVKRGAHVGSAALNSFAAEADPQPKLIVCGHIHEAYGSYDMQGVPVVNVSYLDERYKPVNAIVDITSYIYEDHNETD